MPLFYMKFRTFLLTLTLCLFAFQGFSLDLPAAGNIQTQQSEALTSLKDYSDRKLGFKEKLALKLVKKKVQKMQKRMMANEEASGAGYAAPSIDKGVYIIVAILIPFLAVGLATNFEGSDWLICLLLTFLFYLPGLIYALIKMNDYDS